MKMLKTGLLSVALALAVAPAFAESNPRAGSHDSRVRIATYADGQVYRLRVSLTHVTSVEFGEGETIRSILAGDTEGFQLDGVPGGRAFAVKPLARGVSTNITVYTNRRSYYFTVTVFVLADLLRCPIPVSTGSSAPDECCRAKGTELQLCRLGTLGNHADSGVGRWDIHLFPLCSKRPGPCHLPVFGRPRADGEQPADRGRRSSRVRGEPPVGSAPWRYRHLHSGK